MSSASERNTTGPNILAIGCEFTMTLSEFPDAKSVRQRALDLIRICLTRVVRCDKPDGLAAPVRVYCWYARGPAALHVLQLRPVAARVGADGATSDCAALVAPCFSHAEDAALAVDGRALNI